MSPSAVERLVTRKITLAAAGKNRTHRKAGQAGYLGNLSSQRLGRYAKDYVECMWLILQHDKLGGFP